MQAILDDQIVKTQSMRASPFIGPLEKEALEWDETLNRLQEVVDNWLACQATWQYLEPIFTSPDIMKQMPEEGDKFLQVLPFCHAVQYISNPCWHPGKKHNLLLHVGLRSVLTCCCIKINSVAATRQLYVKV